MQLKEIKLLKNHIDNGKTYLAGETLTLTSTLSDWLVTEGIGEFTTGYSSEYTPDPIPEPVNDVAPVKTFGYKSKKSNSEKENENGSEQCSDLEVL